MNLERQFEQRGRRIGWQEGRQEGQQVGIQQGEAAAVKRLIERRFGAISPVHAKKIDQADPETLLLWIDRLIDFEPLDKVFR